MVEALWMLLENWYTTATVVGMLGWSVWSMAIDEYREDSQGTYLVIHTMSQL